MLSDLLLIGAILGIAYFTTAIVVTLRFASSGRPSTARLRRSAQDDTGEARSVQPSVSILKPIRGAEPFLYENLASFCTQDYGEFEVIFCLHDAADAAMPIVQRVVADFPSCRATILTGTDAAYRNPKIANLVKGARAVTGDIVVISDSDVCVEPAFLRTFMETFHAERVGAASCLYRGIATEGWVSRLGAMYVEEQFAPSVLVAATLGKPRFCLGAAMAVRRTVLDAIGGIEALGAYLADDHALGELVAARGYTVGFSDDIVATRIPESSVPQLWSHELRWARTNLVLAPAGYAFSFLTFGVPLALLYLTVSRNAIIGLPILAIAAVLRIALRVAAQGALEVRESRPLWLVPIRDLLSVGIWVASFFGRSVRWRDARVVVSPDGTMR